MMSFHLSSEAAGSGFPEKSSGDADNAPDPKSPRDTPYGSRDKWQYKTHILSFNPWVARPSQRCSLSRIVIMAVAGRVLSKSAWLVEARSLRFVTDTR